MENQSDIQLEKIKLKIRYFYKCIYIYSYTRPYIEDFRKKNLFKFHLFSFPENIQHFDNFSKYVILEKFYTFYFDYFFLFWQMCGESSNKLRILSFGKRMDSTNNLYNLYTILYDLQDLIKRDIDLDPLKIETKPWITYKNLHRICKSQNQATIQFYLFKIKKHPICFTCLEKFSDKLNIPKIVYKCQTIFF